MSDPDAREEVLRRYSEDLLDPDTGPVVWLALAAAQSALGRLDDDVREKAVGVIDSNVDLNRFADDARQRGQRQAVLDKLRSRLEGPQPERKRIRRPPRSETTLLPGDVLGFRAPSGRMYLLAVRSLHLSRYGLFPVVRLLEFEERDLPSPRKLARIKDRNPGATAMGDRPAKPWWAVEGIVMDGRGHDYADSGFEVVAHVDAMARQSPTDSSSYNNWRFWREYLVAQDQLLTNGRDRRPPGLI